MCVSVSGCVSVCLCVCACGGGGSSNCLLLNRFAFALLRVTRRFRDVSHDFSEPSVKPHPPSN